MNRPKELNDCLKALWSSSYQPHRVIVSDNSIDADIQEQSRKSVNSYQNSIYLEGPRTGVTANRNNALRAAPDDTDYIIFLADDIIVPPDFFELASSFYKNLSSEKRAKTIITGDNLNELSPPDIGPLGVNFRGYFCSWKAGLPQVVNLYATIFPKSFLDHDQWDENIFLGQEDIELSLRAINRGYNIVHHKALKVYDTCFQKTTLSSAYSGPLQKYEIYVAASRLYVGIKRYKHLFPNVMKLLMFIFVYYTHMTIYLLRRQSLHSWPEILKTSNANAL